MANYNNVVRRGALFSLSTLALATSLSVQAYEFEVGDTTASIYGYAKLDLIYDVDNDLGVFGANPNVALDGEQVSTGHTRMHANQSRIAFETSTPTDQGALRTVIEGDFYGDGGGQFRLRHAYGEWNGIRAGQSETNFGTILGMTRIIDFKPQPGLANGARQGQLRYTTGGFSVALEEPGALGGGVASGFSAVNGRPAVHANSKNSVPDVTMRYSGQVGDFRYGSSALLRRLGVDDGAEKDSATAWALNLEGEYRVSPAVTLRGSVTHGDGVGGYIEEAAGASAYVDPVSGNVNTIRATGATASIQLAAGPGHINLGYGYTTAELDGAVQAGVANAEFANETMTDTHLNYIWSPIRNVSYGVEVSRHTRKIANGDDGDAIRLQGMVMYRF